MSTVNKINNSSLISNINSTYVSKTSSTSFSSYLGESKSLDDIFQKASDKYDVDVNLLKSIGKAESDFREKVVSRCGAVGIMQLMPSTSKSLGVNDPYDAEQNIMGGAKYIKELLNKYNGDTSLALAAYNAGMGNVSKYGGIPPFEETQNYVKKILNYMKSDIQTGVTVTQSASSSGSSGVNSNISSMIPAGSKIYTSSNLDRTLSDLENDTSVDSDELFSYDQYLEFLDLYMKYMDSKEEEDDENKKESYNSTLQALNYSAPVLNLINQTQL